MASLRAIFGEGLVVLCQVGEMIVVLEANTSKFARMYLFASASQTRFSEWE